MVDVLSQTKEFSTLTPTVAINFASYATPKRKIAYLAYLKSVRTIWDYELKSFASTPPLASQSNFLFSILKSNPTVFTESSLSRTTRLQAEGLQLIVSNPGSVSTSVTIPSSNPCNNPDFEELGSVANFLHTNLFNVRDPKQFFPDMVSRTFSESVAARGSNFLSLHDEPPDLEMESQTDSSSEPGKHVHHPPLSEDDELISYVPELVVMLGTAIISSACTCSRLFSYFAYSYIRICFLF